MTLPTSGVAQDIAGRPSSEFGARDIDHERAQAHAPALEHRDRFDVRRMRKHVHDPCADQLESVGFDQDSGVPRQAPRMTGNIHDSPGGATVPCVPGLQRRRPAAGRAARGRTASAAQGPKPCRLEEIIRVKSAFADAVSSRVRPRLGHQRGVAFDADGPCRAQGDGSVKFPRPQNRSSTRSSADGWSKFIAASTIVEVDLASSPE